MKKLLPILLLSLLVSCGLFWVHRSIHELGDMRWAPTDSHTFEFDNNEERALDVYFILRHVHGFSYPSLAIRYEHQHPDGSINQGEFTVPIKDEKGEYLGDGSVDLWDLEYMFLPAQKFETGRHVFIFTHAMGDTSIPLVMETGLLLKKAGK